MSAQPVPSSPTSVAGPRPRLRLAGSAAPGSSAALAAPATERLIPIERVAAAMGRSEGAVRVLCQRRWASAGLASIRTGSDGRTRWHVDRAAHPALLREHAGPALEHRQDVEQAWARLTSAQREDSLRRARLVLAFRRWRAQPGVHVRDHYGAFVALVQADPSMGDAPPMTSVYRWDRRAPATTDATTTEIAMHLLDRRGGDRRAQDESVSDDAWSAFAALYLREPPISLALAHKHVATLAQQQGWTWCGESRCRQLVRERLPARVRDYARLGPRQADKLHLPPLEQDPDKWLPGECWLGDHSIFDFFTRVQSGGQWVARRLWLTCWLDWRTRLLAGWHIAERPSGTTIRLALLHALSDQRRSVPTRVWIDNGKDYQGRQLHGVTRAASTQRRLARAQRDPASAEHQRATAETCQRLGLFAMLGIETHFALPYNHNGKARIESFFGIVHRGYCRMHESWSGSRPGDRDHDALAASVADVLALPTLDDVRESFAAWARHYNTDADRKIPELDGLCPLEFYTQHAGPARLASEHSLRELELEFDAPRKVGKRGITMTIGGVTLRYGAGHPKLIDLVRSGELVLPTYNPSDTSTITVRGLDGRMICIAERNREHGRIDDPVSRDMLRQETARRNAQRREALRRIDIAREILSPVESAALAARDAQATERQRAIEAASPPRGVRLVQTPLDQDAELSQRLREQQNREPVLDLPRGPSINDLIAEIGGSALAPAPAAAHRPRAAGISLAELIAHDGEAV